MVLVRLSRWCAALASAFVCGSFLLASCATPEFKFVDGNGNQPPHCQNQQRDEGESDVDCGGSCSPCALTQGCNGAADCRDGDCIDGVCQGSNCNDGSQNESETDVDCGGGSCKTCPVGGGCSEGKDCQSGVCGDSGCAAATCGDRVKNGNESDIDCGGGDCSECVEGQTCLTPSDCVGNECTAGKCALSCAAGVGNCDADASNGCETNLRTDADHCGDCNTACSLSNAKSDCAGGVCRVASCVAPFDDCNGDPTDGCEVNTKTDVENCGACAAKPCPSLNGTAYCSDSKCGLTCASNFRDCDGEAGNGCEKDVSRDINNCGGCGKTCTAGAGKTAWCRNGQCGETTCAAGRGDCNGDPDDDAAHNGCETDLKTNADSCGTCGNICGISGGEAQCTSGTCSVKTCSTGLADCNKDYVDGCETKTTTDLANCGACGKTCTTTNGAPACVSGACQVKTCTAPFADCNGTTTDGCETNTSTSQTHCGACTGASANCDTVFPHASGQCTSGVCKLNTCAAGYENCNTAASDGCEVNLGTDVNHCGTCTTACSTTGTGSGGTSCMGGKCLPKCTGTLLTCNAASGCTVDGATDENNCGECGKICSAAANAHVDSGGNQCLSGKCNPSCATNYDDCDSKPENGCEKSVATDASNCGGCNVTCGPTNTSSAPTCASGSCVFSCQGGWAACGAPAAGCATKLGTVSNCRSCGEACTGTNKYCTSNGCVAHFDIAAVGTSVSAIKGFESVPSGTFPTLTANHTLVNSKAAGVSRIVLVGVTAIDPYLGNKFVWYDNVLMHAAIEKRTNETPGSYAGIFYLLDNELPTNAGSKEVKVQFYDMTTNGTGAFTVSEFQNVQQSPSPFAVSPVNQSTDADCGNPSTRSVALSFTQAGSFGYAVMGLRQGTGAMPVPGTVTQTQNSFIQQPSPLGAVAGYKGPIDSSATLSWSVANCPNNAGVGAVLKRVGD